MADPASPTDVSLLAAKGVSHHFAGAAAGDVGAPVLAEVDLELRQGEVVALVGESGGGKTTLVRILLGLLQPTAGQVEFAGAALAELRSLRELRNRVQLVSQDPHSALDPGMSVGAAIKEGYLVQRPWLPRGERRERTGRLLEALGLPPEYRWRRPAGLSGGEQRRVVIARALAALGYGDAGGPPRALLADEPTAGLDAVVSAQVLHVLQAQRRELNLACLLVSHDLAVVRRLADRVVVLYGGRVVEVGRTAAVLERPAHPYTQQLVAAVALGAAGDVVPGDREAAGDDRPAPGVGCAFEAACAHPDRDERCREEAPELAQLDGDSERRARCLYAAGTPLGTPEGRREERRGER